MSPRLRNLLLTTTALLSLGAIPGAAGPDGGTIVGGAATIAGQGTSSVIVNQTSNRAIINWHTFDIGTGESTRFNQPNSSAVTLNRVTGGMGASTIDGMLTANGRVFVINRDGMLFGRNAVINTNGFLATTSDIKNDDFMAGRYQFNIPGRPDASIVNFGNITAASGGFGALVAPGVRNTGTITATLGTVALASGNTFTLDMYGDKLIQVAVSDEIAGKVIDVSTGQPLKSLVSNEGALRANGGRVELTAAAARHIVDSVINTSGVIEANSVGTRGGKIILGGATESTKGAGLPKQTVKVAGKLSAKGNEKGAKGGTIQITGEDIQFAAAMIDVAGAAGGGKVLAGGDWAGGHPNGAIDNQAARLEGRTIATATTLSVDAATSINASATQNGHGGKVILWSDVQTTFAGTILARGGEQGGDGGFVEVSGKRLLVYAGLVDTQAPYGTAGTLLLDPFDVTISTDPDISPSTFPSNGTWVPTDNGSNINVTTLGTQLGLGNVVVTTAGSGTESGDITVRNGFSWTGNNSLTLSAHRNIQINDGVTITHSNGTGNLVLRADSEGSGRGTIVMVQDVGSKIDFTNSSGRVSFFYNPSEGYSSPIDFTPAGQGAGRGVLTNGSVANQFTAYMLVNNVADLQNISTNLAGTYALGTNINASETAGWNEGKGFVPLGAPDAPFVGLLDGQNRTIDKLTIAPNDATTRSIGLFSVIGPGGSVRNLNLTAANVSANPGLEQPIEGPPASQWIGILAGSSGGTINNVSVAGVVNGGSVVGVIAGGMVGEHGLLGPNSSPGSISNSQAAVTVTVGAGAGDCFLSCTMNIAGGLVGANTAGSTITQSSASGAVTAGGMSWAGGLVGQNGFFPIEDGGVVSGSIANSFASGNVTMTGLNGAAGGLVGSNSPGSTITDSQATGTASANASAPTNQQFTDAGGLVGQNAGTITSTTQPSLDGSLPTCAQGASFSCAIGAVSVGTHGTGGGLVGFNQGTITMAFATGAVTGASGLGEHGGTNLGGLAGTNQGTITNSRATGAVGNADADNLNAGGLVGDNSGTITNSRASGHVTTGDNSSGGGLVGGNTFSDCCFNQGDGANDDATITGSHAIGSVTVGTISAAGGLAGVSGGTLTNVTSSGAVNGGHDSVLGGLVGALTGGQLDSTTTASGNVTGTGANSMIGGLVGLNLGTITGATSTVDVQGGTGSSIGGLVGANLGSILSSHTTAAVSVTGGDVDNFVGGLVGANVGKIHQSTSAATVNGGSESAIGGLVGANFVITSSAEGGIPSNMIPGSTFPVGTITASSATGNVTGGALSAVGGLVGANGGSISGSSASGNVNGGSGAQLGGLVGTNSAPDSTAHVPAILSQDCEEAICNVIANSSILAGPGTITGSHAIGDVAGVAGSVVGGFAGINAGSISLSSSTGAVSGTTASLIGGFVGANFGTINQAYTKGAVTGGDSSFVGGFAGLNFGIPGITQSYALGPATGANAAVAAAFAALNLGSLDQVYGVGHVVGGPGALLGGLVAANQLGGGLPPLGGLVDLPGVVPTGTATNSFWDFQTTAQLTSAGGTGMNTAELSSKIPPGFDPAIWAHGSYPHLVNLGPQNTEPGPPVIPPVDNNPPPDLPPIDQQVIPVNLNTTGPGGEIVNTQPVLQQQAQQGGQQQGGSQTTGSVPPGPQPIRLDVGADRYFYLPPPNETRLIIDEVVLELPCDVPQDQLKTILSQHRLTVIASQCLETGKAAYRMRFASGQTIAGVIRALAAHRIIAAAQANYTYALTQPSAQPAGQGDPDQYVPEKLRLPEIHRTLRGTNIPIAVIDSEIDGAHPDISGTIAERFDATGVEDNPHAHGTGMAGAIVSHRRLLGIAPGARIIAVRAFSSRTKNAESTTFHILKGLDWAVNNKVRIVNMSFAGPRDPSLERAIKDAYDAGVVLIAAAGNAGPKSPPLYPAADRHVIAVTATDIDDKLFTGANRGNHVAIAAPGVDILVPAPAGEYQMTTGTSVATAHISGVVALMLERNPRLTPADVRRILTQSAKKLGPNNEFGAGLVDPVRAIELAAPRQAGAPGRQAAAR